MEGAVTQDVCNKENIPPVCTNAEKKKNPIPPMVASFKRNSKRMMKRVPLADITNLFDNSVQEHSVVSENGVSALHSSSVVLDLNTRRRTQLVLLRGSKKLRMGIRWIQFFLILLHKYSCNKAQYSKAEYWNWNYICNFINFDWLKTILILLFLS